VIRADEAALAEAVQVLVEGGLVAFPTETVYGLGADACSDAAVARIFAAKGRPSDHPLIVHVGGVAQLPLFAAAVPACAHGLAAALWPGPLTLILPRRAGVASASAAGHNSIGLRAPAHPLAQRLLAACAAQGVLGLAAPSANRFGRVSPTTAAHVQAEFGADLLILDGGACTWGIESSIVDCTRGVPVLLRPGVLTRQAIETAAGEPLWANQELATATPAPRASGSLASHYAPTAKLRLMDAPMLQTALDLLGPDLSALAVYARSPLNLKSSAVRVRRMPDDALAVAHQLFAVLREFDAQGVRLIWVEAPPADSAWDGVRDRLMRAAA